MNHPTQKIFLEFLRDSLPADQEASLLNHLDHCPACRKTLDIIVENTFSILPSIKSQSVTKTKSFDQMGLDRISTNLFPEFQRGSKFIIISELARGGMGVVYRGFDREIKREIAIKVTRNHQIELAARFMREAQISGQLQHPGIAPVYEVGQLSDQRFFMAMRLVRGRTLLKQLTASTAQPAEPQYAKNLEVFGQICQTMAFAHAKNIVHRDLKPENIMIGAFGEVQIMDWGLAKNITTTDSTDTFPDSRSNSDTIATRSPDQTIAGQLMGTPAYMAPEQAKGEAITKRTDVFAMGGILFQMLTGKAPFEAATHTGSIAKSTNASTEELYATLKQTHADPLLIELAQSCLQPSPANRPPDAEVVNQQFEAYIKNRELDRQNTKLAEARVTERLISQQKRNRQLVWSGSAILLMLIVSAVVGFLYLDEKNTRLANQAKIEQQRLAETLRDEQQIRLILDTAAKHEQLAKKQNPVDQSEQWILAKKEFEKTKTVLSDNIDPALRSECQQTGQRIADATRHAIQIKKNHDQEVTASTRIRTCADYFFCPRPLKSSITRKQSVSSELADVFLELGISLETNVEHAARRIAASNLKPDLLLGLMIWQRELTADLATDIATSKWLQQLIERSDTDRFRTTIRHHQNPVTVEDLKKVVRQRDAVRSILSVHTVVNRFGLAPEFHDAFRPYLQRAALRFQNEPLVNWYLALVEHENSVRQGEASLKCSVLSPSSLGALWLQGKANVAQGQFKQAIDPLNRLTQLVPRFADARIQLAIALGKNYDFNQAIKHFQAAVELDPDRPEIYLHRAELLVRYKNFEPANADLKRFRELQPNSTAADDLLVQNYKQENRKWSVVKELNRIIENRPQAAGYFGQLFDTYEEIAADESRASRRRTELTVLSTARENYLELAAKLPTVVHPYEILCRHEERRENLPNAVRFLQKAIERLPAEDPNLAPWIDRLAELSRRRYLRAIESDFLKPAIEDLVQVTQFIAQRDKDSIQLPKLYTALGRLYQKDGQLDKAIEATQEAYRVQKNTPDDAWVTVNVRGPLMLSYILEFFGLPSEYTKLEGAGKSKEALRRLHDPKAVSFLGMLMLKQGEEQQVESMIRGALSKKPDSAMLRFVLAKSLAAQAIRGNDQAKQKECFKILEQLEFLDQQFDWDE